METLPTGSLESKSAASPITRSSDMAAIALKAFTDTKLSDQSEAVNRDGL